MSAARGAEPMPPRGSALLRPAEVAQTLGGSLGVSVPSLAKALRVPVTKLLE